MFLVNIHRGGGPSRFPQLLGNKNRVESASSPLIFVQNFCWQQAWAGYTGFRVDGTTSKGWFKRTPILKDIFGVCTIYSETTVMLFWAVWSQHQNMDVSFLPTPTQVLLAM